MASTIAENKSREETLQVTAELNPQLIEWSLDCIEVLDLDGRVLSMNFGGMKMLEIQDFEPLKNSPWVEFWHGQDKEAAQAAVAAALGRDPADAEGCNQGQRTGHEEAQLERCRPQISIQALHPLRP